MPGAEGGVVLRSTGTGWERVESGAEFPLQAVWVSTPDNVWAVGGIADLDSDRQRFGVAPSEKNLGIILHWDGQHWTTTMRSRHRLTAIHGSGPNDVWAVGAHGSIFHFDGRRWSLVKSALIPATLDLTDVWAATPGDAWTVGTHGTILHFDGKRWRPVQSGTHNRLWAIDGHTLQILVTGSRGTILALPRQ